MVWRNFKSLAYNIRTCVPFKNVKLNNSLFDRKYATSDVTAGILVIGDEILKGITDINTPYLIKELNAMNVKVAKVSIVPDNVDTISSEIQKLSSDCSFVVTSGGIGPTHDDVTYAAVAKACNDELELNKNILQLLVNYFGPESRNNPGIIKYSYVPRSAVMDYINFKHNNKLVKYPIVSVQNIFIFPGVPSLLKKCFEHMKHRFIVTNKASCTKDVYLNIDEFSITAVLNEAVKKFNGHVKFGSYPSFTDNYYKVQLVLESQLHDYIEEAWKFLNEHLPEGSIISIKKDTLLCAEDDVYALCKTSSTVSSAVSVIEKTIGNYSLSDLCLCFNGGKDCTALLHLLYACVQHLKPKEWNKVQFLYVRCGEPFHEVEVFIQNCAKLYNFNLTVLDGDLKHSVSAYLKTYSNVKAMLLGIRKCDPGASGLHNFCSTDSDWPSVMRVLPLLDWTYSDVWFFLRKLQIPYCILYDQGYTSLGDKLQSVQNPSLYINDHNGFWSFKPAYMLKDQNSERNSRLE